MEKLICNSRRGGAKTSSFARVVALALAGAAGALSTRAALPAEYQQLEYIQASGQCRIKTSVTPAYNDKVEMTWMPTTVSGNQNLWCARTATSKQFTGFMIGATFRFDRGDGTAGQKTSATAFVANTRYSILADYGAGVSTISNDVTLTQVTTVSNSTGSYEAGSALAIFASHNNNIDDGLNNWGSYRLYAFKLRNSGGTLRLDLVPAKRLSGQRRLSDERQVRLVHRGPQCRKRLHVDRRRERKPLHRRELVARARRRVHRRRRADRQRRG